MAASTRAASWTSAGSGSARCWPGCCCPRARWFPRTGWPMTCGPASPRRTTWPRSGCTSPGCAGPWVTGPAPGHAAARVPTRVGAGELDAARFGRLAQPRPGRLAAGRPAAAAGGCARPWACGAARRCPMSLTCVRPGRRRGAGGGPADRGGGPGRGRPGLRPPRQPGRRARRPGGRSSAARAALRPAHAGPVPLRAPGRRAGGLSDLRRLLGRRPRHRPESPAAAAAGGDPAPGARAGLGPGRAVAGTNRRTAGPRAGRGPRAAETSGADGTAGASGPARRPGPAAGRAAARREPRRRARRRGGAGLAARRDDVIHRPRSPSWPRSRTCSACPGCSR